VSDDRYGLLYTEAVRQISAQQGDLDQLRSRAAGIVAAIAIATSFLGANLIRTKDLSWVTWTAAGCFAVSVALAVWVVASPARAWATGFSPVQAYTKLLVERTPMLKLSEMHVELIHQLEQAMTTNDSLLSRRRRTLAAAGCFLATEIIFWLVDIRL
jgi:hypothetical protein